MRSAISYSYIFIFFFVFLLQSIKAQDSIDFLEKKHKAAIKLNALTGKVNYANHRFYAKVNPVFCNKTTYLQKEVYAHFLMMYLAAKIDGVSLKIISGARSFWHQKSIWERKWKQFKGKPLEKAKHILNFSAMPMTSRHHWGTEIDFNNLNNSYFESGEGLKVYQWLVSNAYKFGFCQVYTHKSKGDRKGYEMEKWHWSYVPIAGQYLKKYNELISYKDIQGFLGSKIAKELQIVENYVNGLGECDR